MHISQTMGAAWVSLLTVLPAARSIASTKRATAPDCYGNSNTLHV